MLWWLLHRVTAVVLLFGLLFHFYFMHLSGVHNYSYESIIERLNSPYWIGFNAIFLLSSIYHGFYGINGLITEYVKDRVFRGIFRFFTFALAGVLTVFGLSILFH